MSCSVLKAEKVESAYESLQHKTTDVYIQRARQLYTVAPQRTGLFLWTLNDVSIIALADPSHHGHDNVVRVMREIDPSRSVSLIHLCAFSFALSRSDYVYLNNNAYIYLS